MFRSWNRLNYNHMQEPNSDHQARERFNERRWGGRRSEQANTDDQSGDCPEQVDVAGA